MSSVPEYKPEPMAPAIVITTVLLGVLIFSALLWSQFAPTDYGDWTDAEAAQIRGGLNFPPLRVDQARLDAARAEHYDAPDISLIADEVETLRSLARKANLAQFPIHNPADRINIEELDLQLRFTAEEVVPVVGIKGFQSLGEPLFRHCTRGVHDLVRAVERGQIPLDQALEDPPADRFREYRENCGNFLPLLVQRNLVTEDGRWDHREKDALIEILQRYRWADLIHSQYTTHHQISRYELEIFYRWTIEDSRAFEPLERRRYLQRAQGILPESYDFELARARLAIADQDLEAAADRFQALKDAHPSNALYAEIHKEILRQLGRASSQ